MIISLVRNFWKITVHLKWQWIPKRNKNTYKEVHELLAAAKQGRTNKYKTLDMDDNDLRKRHYFTKEHLGHFYVYLKRRKHIVMPKVSTKEGMLCGIADLELDTICQVKAFSSAVKIMPNKH